MHRNRSPVPVGILFGTRPEAIKLAPLILQMKADPRFETSIISTGQHDELLTQVFDTFRFKPDFRLNVMQPDQTLAALTSRLASRVGELLSEHPLEMLLVQGDTTSALVGSLCAFYQRIPVGHVEAGLRSDDRHHPFPEEVNRRCITQVADYHFAPTKVNQERLLREGIAESRIRLTGNTGVDALLWIASRFDAFGDPELANFIAKWDRIILVTCHRRENFGSKLASICEAIQRIAAAHRSDIGIVVASHPNPQVQQVVRCTLSDISNVVLLAAQDYVTFIGLMKSSYLILSDSGGVQEEAPALGKPVLVLREKTERPEAIEIGACTLVGTDTERIVSLTEQLLTDSSEYRKRAPGFTPYGDGRASTRIINFLLREFGFESELLPEFQARTADRIR